jgi:His/Glu/Gln/Arg/opine family amino acid ABC transporter permease subunit
MAFDDNALFFFQGFRNTLILAVGALATSLVIGTFMASLRVWGGDLARSLAGAYVEFFRNTPLLVQLLFYAVLLAPANLGITGDPLVAAMIGLSIYTGAFMTEVVRSGILSVDVRQLEAARSLGLSQLQAVRFVVMPQAIRTVIPPLGNLSIALVKNTSVAGGIAAFELLKVASVLETQTAQFNWFIAALVGFWALTIPLAWLVGQLERRLAFSR